MVINDYISFLKEPDKNTDTIDLKSIVKQYPYFQSARALHLKTLKKKDSFKYNHQLKVTAAYTTDRTILFNFITSEKFNTVTQERELPKIKPAPNDNETFLLEVKDSLTIGKPISFSENETHSFSQWLQLASKKPILREVKPIKKKIKKQVL